MTDIATAGTVRLAGVLSKAFSIYGRRIVPFVILAVLGQIPDYVVLFWLGATPTAGEDPAVNALRVGLLQVNAVSGFLAIGAIAYGVIQELHGQTVSVGASIAAALRRFLPILGFLLIYYVALIVGVGLVAGGGGLAAFTLGLGKFSLAVAVGAAAVAIGIPLFMAMCMFWLAVPVCVVEKAGVFTSMSRSRFLTKGYRWQLFGTFLLIMAVSFGVVAVVGVSSGAGIIGIATGNAPVGPTFAYYGLGAFLFAFIGVFTGVFYYDLRVAKEGVDIAKIGGVFD